MLRELIGTHALCKLLYRNYFIKIVSEKKKKKRKNAPKTKKKNYNKRNHSLDEYVELR